MKRPEAERLVTLGIELMESGRAADAEGAYRAARDADSSWSVPWYNLGLVCKYQRRWQESFDFNRRAAELDAEDVAAWWNLGIAATALGEWSEARRAWQQCRLPIDDGDDPPNINLGLTPIRLDPDGRGEVVWAHRIDPARARLANVPLPLSPYRWRDLVLHDGAPEGSRMRNGKEVPVFNVLDTLERSEFLTFVVELGTSDPAIIEKLEDIAHNAGAAGENWGRSTRILCKQCSLGLPHEHADDDSPPAHAHFGIATRNQTELKSILDEWIRSTPGADFVRWTGPDGELT